MRTVPCFLLAFFLCGCQQPQLYRQTQVLMGTFVEVISPDPRAPAIVFSEIRRIEGMLSKYLPESEVSQLNKNGWVKASPEMFEIMEKSRDFWELSHGAFDITVGPLVTLWGFTDKNFRKPTGQELQGAKELVGTNKIIFQKKDYVVKFMLPGMSVDLGGIAKGFAVDCAINKIKDAGIASCLINAGGQIYGLGDKSGQPWKVAIRSAREKGFEGSFELKNQAAATSGDYEQYFIKEGKRYSHIIDPRTGYPAENKVISSTVIAPDSVTADALSTASFVLGRKESERLAGQLPGVKIKIIEQ